MQQTIRTLQKMSGRTVLVSFILTMSIYLLMLSYTIPKVESFAPGLALFDLSPAGYSFQQAYTLLETLGETGRNVYLTQQLPLDFIYPGLFAFAYSLFLTWLFAKSFSADSKMFALALVPVLGGLFDYLENIAILVMLISFPHLSPGLVGLASTFTLLKGLFTTLFFLLLFLGSIAWLVSRVKRNPKAK